ncbi:uncharacterized protein LOC123531392 [Mercenaria mercenaria]|uniref:uncharacterized protein LOC123531392 n=1 Tax=Mercenaria mercenaria TaxID=6596 RepID=UPI00234EC73F|nr:uncharacterized protein LOC123531392 [Mercenaria mercenaria]XP_045168234.2 uncharacterized protein LOC123531392 [Mercenaria mercenaria]XP_045168235.2 uncharacterized protein LOC123531392 [Mercenaria mercenaria]XP_045168236.2 uncharacterized protein LOC123531392 [Mercenaria mercenaria]XP_045168237.2 uncharacterized protein LOC123531392 [Mercenaria mercenaria]XP_045168238.2 uncharacterized protein LOC123531392 [Mercenaria mercenaria]XP_045168240.2 uncharacterized protein LOC123531392 [Mercen
MRNLLRIMALLVLAPVIKGQVMMDETSGVDALNNIMGGNNGTGRVDIGSGVDLGVGRGPVDRVVDRGVGRGPVDRGVGIGRGIDGNDTILDGRSAFGIESQERLNILCKRRCKTEVCYLSDINDCRNFITCSQDARGNYHATLQPCAFGTYWAGLQKQKKITCDLPENVACKIDYCAGLSEGATYDHRDGNCKTYWECDRYGKSFPKCCPDGFRYSNRRGECVQDRLSLCQDKCPIKIDACLVPGTKTEFFDDGNCVTYWNCEDLHPHPVCCPEGQGYDVIQGCIDNRLCKHKCPDQYKPDICLKPGIEKYSLIDGSCRTYMRCNAIEGDERWCCPSNYVFDSNTQKCTERTPNMNVSCSDHCPQNYNEVCTLKPAYNASMYMVVHHGIEMEMPCAPGTLFDVTKCGCATPIPGAPDNSCRKELDILFDAPTWYMGGSESKVKIVKIGTQEEGPKLNGRISYKFNGDLYFRIPYFQSQYDNLYIKLVYLPEDGASAGNFKQVMLSNCMSIDLGAPSMELSLQNNRAVLELTTDVLSNETAVPYRPVVASVDITPGIWNTLTAIYNGRDIYMLNEGQGQPTFDRQPLTGAISVAAEGLDFGGCVINRDLKEGFRGSLAELQFSKCLNQKWVDIFNANIPAQPAQP